MAIKNDLFWGENAHQGRGWAKRLERDRNALK